MRTQLRSAVVVVGAILATALAGAASPAASPDDAPRSSPSPIVQAAAACRSANALGHYAESYVRCVVAAAAFRARPVTKATSFSSYRNSAEMYSYAASDQIALGNDADALRIASAAHRELLAITATVAVSPREYRDARGIAANLQRIERTAQQRIATNSARSSARVSQTAELRRARPATSARYEAPGSHAPEAHY